MAGHKGMPPGRVKLSLVFRVVISVAGGVALAWFLLLQAGRDAQPASNHQLPEPLSPSEAQPEPAPEPEPPPDNRPLYYPTDLLFTTSERKECADGEIILEIPRLGFRGPVYAGTADAQLDKGVGLYDFASLPGYAPPQYIDNFNLSIAGHRDLRGCEFYYIDAVTQGDLFFVECGGKRHTFTYLETFVVEPGDWSVIHCIDKPALTLTSCTPLGTSRQRIIIRAVLTDTVDLQGFSDHSGNSGASEFSGSAVVPGGLIP